VPSESDPEAFFANLAATALARAKAAPTLVEVTPLIGRGWCLGFRVANEQRDIVQVNALSTAGSAAALEYSYRPAKLGSPQREQHLDRVGHLLCKALERAPIDGELPPLGAEAEALDDEPPPRETMSLWLPGECDRGCIFCSVSLQPDHAPDVIHEIQPRPLRLPLMHSGELSRGRAELEAKLRANADRAAEIQVEWSGKDCLLSRLFDDGLQLAYALGYRDMSVQTPGSRLLEDGFIEFLREHSVVRVGLTAHAGDQATFDAVGGKPGAHELFWTGFARLLEAGFDVSVEVPCIANTVDGLPQHLAKLATYACRITCFFWYPDQNMDGTFAVMGMPYARAVAALEQARELIAPQRIAIDGIPECVVSADLRQHFFWSYGGGHMTFIDFERVPACERCAARDRCPGVVPAYVQHHEFSYQPLSASLPDPSLDGLGRALRERRDNDS
jgi:hypothetical protein